MQGLRCWQKEALRQYRELLEQGIRATLWEATPGAGKTTAALRLCLHQLRRQGARRMLVVVPTTHLKLQWARAAAAVGIQLDHRFRGGTRIASDFNGAVVTYQQLGSRPRQFRELSAGAVVVLDEIHHAADGLTWGDALRFALSDCSFMLCLSGTAFRSDQNAIPFVRYDPAGVSLPDYSYPYPRAVEEGVCRPVAFFSYGGDVVWTEKERSVEVSFSDAVEREVGSRRLRAALDPATGWIQPMLRDAQQMLIAIRREQPDAGALLVAANQTHARELAEALRDISKEQPVVVLSDDRSASRRLKEFERSRQPWLVACNMVSEGVDIPRLRIGVYATTVRTKMYFRQFLGRIVRKLPSPRNVQTAYCYLPADRWLVTLAEEIEEEQRHCLNARPEREWGEREARAPDAEEPTEQWQPLLGRNSGVEAVIVGGNQLSFWGGSAVETETMKETVDREVLLQLEQSLTKSEVKASLGREVKQLAARYHRQSGRPYAVIHTFLNRTQNVRSQAECTQLQLVERARLLRVLLREST